MAAFPAAKLGALVLKQVSKPIAARLKSYAKSSPFFRKFICMPPAQFYNWVEVKMKMWMLNMGKPVNVPALNEQQAIELGANLLGEGVIFGIAALLLISEYNRSAAKEVQKDAILSAEKRKIEARLQDLYFITQAQATQINELRRHIFSLEGNNQQGDQSHKASGTDPPRKEPPSKTDGAPQGHKHPTNKSTGLKPVNTQNKFGVTSFQLNSQLVACAYDFVEHDLFTNHTHTPSIVTLAIDHLYYNVYQLSG